MTALYREVRYEPFLCRFGWHKWRCALRQDWWRQFLIRCRDVAVHVHHCARCGRVRVEGRPCS